jgi:MFS family permease
MIPPASKPPDWLLALGATLLAQSVSSFMGQCLPVVAPLLTASAGIAPQRIGNLSSLTSFGTVLFLLFGGPLLVRFGPVRTLQLGSACAVAAMLVAATGWWPALIAAALLLGLAYGPTPPAGSRILAATAPPQHRTLIFSIKQAGAPAGGALAGLIIAPFAVRYGWPAALLLAIVACLLSAAAIAPLRRMMDSERDRTRSIHPRALFHRDTLLGPIATLRADPLLTSITVLAISFSFAQGTLYSFSVTYLTERGLSLPNAGFAYACLQASGVFARVFLGWFADRTGKPAHNLTAQAFVAAACLLLYATMPVGASLPITAAIAGLTGFFCASWNGIYMAEVARLAPPDQVADATASSTMFIFLGYVAGPSLFALAVPLVGWQAPYVVVAAQLAAVALVQTVLLSRQGRRGAAPRPARGQAPGP